MRKAPFITVCRTQNSVEVERMVGLLRNVGLHPADLPLSTPLAVGNDHPMFPVQVPTEEAEAARQVLHLPFEEAA